MNLSLAGRRILVTRPKAQATELAAQIAAHGGEAECFPLIEISPIEDWAAFDSAMVRLDAVALLVFISPNAVDFSLPRLLAARTWPRTLQAAAIGPGTVRRLADFGISGVIAPENRFDSEALLDLPPLQESVVGGKHVLILRGNGGRELLAETLRTRGAIVECIPCYRRSAPRDAVPLMSLLRDDALDALTLSSSEGLRNLLELLDTDSFDRLRALPVFVPHQRIAEEAARLGVHRVVLTGPADAGLVEGLCNYPWPDHER